MEDIKDNHKEACLKCTLKHVMNSKTFLMEAIQFGFKTNTNVEDINELTLEIVNYIINTKGVDK